MAACDDGDPLFRFVNQAKYCFQTSYPNWKEIFNASPEQQLETICIPDALDVLSNRRLETYRSITAELETDEFFATLKTDEKRKKVKNAFKHDIVGQTGVDNFFAAFRSLKLGGLLISGFDTQEFVAKLISEKAIHIDYKDYTHFECDAIFLHLQLGVFIIETKGCKNRKIERRYKAASKQLDTRITGMKEIYKKITGNACPFDFKGVICIPNAGTNFSQEKYKVLGQFEMESTNFKKFWFSHEAGASRSINLDQSCPEAISDDFVSFISTIAGFRYAKFVTMLSNALEIYRVIDQQDFERGKKQDLATADAIILKGDQLSAAKCSEQHIIISGPPGTGKTTVLLLRALEAAKLKKRGRVVIVTGYYAGAELKSLFQKFLAAKQEGQMKRQIFVTRNLDENLSWRNYLQDDLFIDEMPVKQNFHSAFMKKREKWRKVSNSLVTGTTTVVMTGWWDPQKVATDMAKILSSFPGFHHIELKTVIRGTRSIIDNWRRFYPDGFFTIGHNVKGAPVDRISVHDRSHLLTAVEQQVRNLLTVNCNDFCFSIPSQHLAILVSVKETELDEQSVSPNDIKNHLNKKGFLCGDLEDQIKKNHLIAVDFPFNARSFDWPIVIYVRGAAKYDLIAFSRSISKLIIIEIATDSTVD